MISRFFDKQFRVLFFFALVGMVIFTAVEKLAAAEVSPPVVDREAAEEAFLDAYDYFLANRLWDCLDRLNEAEKRNVYFIDVYYMKSLAFRRLGRYTDAINAMKAYLEVRRDDARAQVILEMMEEEWNTIRETLYPNQVDTQLYFRGKGAAAFLGLSMHNPLSYSGLLGSGKLSSSGRNLFLCDTLGNRLWSIGQGPQPSLLSLEAERPVVFLPVAPSEGLLLQEDGEVLNVRIDAKSGNMTTIREGRIQAKAADAAFIDSTLLAVADRTGQAVRFYGMPSMGETAQWQPDDRDNTEKLFEPVALASYGPYLAIADRGNERIFVLDTNALSVRSRFELPAPRDVEWGLEGELYILSENGSLYTHFSPEGKPVDPQILAGDMKDAWTLTWSDRGPIVSSIGGRSWWHSEVNPGNNATFGAVALHRPWIEEREGTETLMLRGAASSIFHSFIHGKVPDSQAIWRNEVRPSRIVQVGSAEGVGARFYSPSAGSFVNTGIAHANTVTDVMADIARISREGGEIPRVLVLDTRITGTDGQWGLFLGFLLQQGVRLDLWAIGRPAPAQLTHISKITLGHTYYARLLETVPPNDMIEWILSVTLPPDTVTFGYPSDATLSIFSTIDVIRFVDWVPIWPSLIMRAPH